MHFEYIVDKSKTLPLHHTNCLSDVNIKRLYKMTFPLLFPIIFEESAKRAAMYKHISMIRQEVLIGLLPCVRYHLTVFEWLLLLSMRTLKWCHLMKAVAMMATATTEKCTQCLSTMIVLLSRFYLPVHSAQIILQ